WPWPAPPRWRPSRRPCMRTRTCPSLSLRLSLFGKLEPRVAAGITARRRLREPRQVVVPTLAVGARRLLVREAAVDEGQARPGPGRLELDLDRARSRRDELRPAASLLPAPGVDQPPGRVDLDELAARDAPRDDAHPDRSTRPRIELGADP